MPFKFGDVRRNLPPKGFAVEDSKHHVYFHFLRNGKKTRYYTYISHGKPDEDVGDGVVRSMKMQLGLSTAKQVRELIECTMSGEQYLEALIQSRGLPKEEQPSLAAAEKKPGKRKR